MVVRITKVRANYAKYLIEAAREQGTGEFFTIARYYASDKDRPGLWYGGGLEALLGKHEGSVASDYALTALMSGTSPKTGASFTGSSGKTDHYSRDVTFDVPKRISVLWAVSEPVRRAEVEDAIVDAFTNCVLPRLEENILTRRGRGGRRRERGATAFAVFLHTTSRASEPHLHLHVVVPNVCVRGDGSTGTLFTRPLYQNARRFDYVFQAAVAARLKHLERELARIPESLIEAWSSRRREIVAAVGENASARARQVAAYKTREQKRDMSPRDRFAKWREEASAHGYVHLSERRQHTETRKVPGKEISDSRISERIARSQEGLREERRLEGSYDGWSLGSRHLLREPRIRHDEGQGLEEGLREATRKQVERSQLTRSERFFQDAKQRALDLSAALRCNLTHRALHAIAPDTLLKYRGLRNLKNPFRVPTHPHEFETLREKAKRMLAPETLAKNITARAAHVAREAPGNWLHDSKAALRANLTARLVRAGTPDQLLRFGVYNLKRPLRPPSYRDEVQQKKDAARRQKEATVGF